MNLDHDTQTDHEKIARMAYLLWLQRGSPEGSPDEDWFRAERGLHARYQPGEEPNPFIYSEAV